VDGLNELLELPIILIFDEGPKFGMHGGGIEGSSSWWQHLAAPRSLQKF